MTIKDQINTFYNIEWCHGQCSDAGARYRGQNLFGHSQFHLKSYILSFLLSWLVTNKQKSRKFDFSGQCSGAIHVYESGVVGEKALNHE